MITTSNLDSPPAKSAMLTHNQAHHSFTT
uniref:Uncharacterized protein n=1 Tax=Rhizophora mucronata TaxID=61149 RepID=A0A2P2JM00_RHIMU